MDSKTLLAALLLVALPPLILAPDSARAQPEPPCSSCVVEDLGMRRHLHDQPARPASRSVGQAALKAIQEVTGLLLADPATDWTEVSLARLREHLVDVDRVILGAQVEELEVEGGLEARVTGEGRTLEALRRLVPPHAEQMDGFRGWRVRSEELADGVLVTVMTTTPEEGEVVRALGFFGLMAAGVHRPHHLLAVARGRWP